MATYVQKGKIYQGDIDVETSLDVPSYGDGTITLAGHINFGRTDDIIITQTDTSISPYVTNNVIITDNRTDEYNLAIGFDALTNVIPVAATTGVNNIAIGKSSLNATTDGKSNIAIGIGSLFLNTTGYQNIGIGDITLSANTVGNTNIAMGFGAAYLLAAGSHNTAIGNGVLGVMTSGSNNSIYGGSAGTFCISGDRNTFIGWQSGISVAGAGNDRISLGYEARSINDYCAQIGENVTTAGKTGKIYFRNQQIVSEESWIDGNDRCAGINATGSIYKTTTTPLTGLGTDNHITRWNGTDNIQDSSVLLADNAAYMDFLPATGIFDIRCDSLNIMRIDNTVAQYNLSIGFDALDNVVPAGVDGIYNIAIGKFALSTGTTVSNDIAIGYNSLKAATSGKNNVAMGNNAGLNITTGNGNTLIGCESAQLLQAFSNNTAVGYMSLHAFGIVTAVDADNNTAFGYYAGKNLRDGHGNTCLGSESDVGAVYGDYIERTSVGYLAYPSSDYSIQFGNPVVSAGSAGVAKFRTQTVSSETWIDAVNALSYIDATGNIQKAPTFVIDIVTGKLTVPGLLDPTGLALTSQAANPGGAYAASTIWVENVNNYLEYSSNNVVLGPLLNTTNTVPRWDGTNTNKMKVSGVTISNTDDITGLASITLTQLVNRFDIDTALTANVDTSVATQRAVKAYVDGKIGGSVSIGVDNHIARYNLTNGIQDSLISIDDTTAMMNLTVVNEILNIKVNTYDMIKAMRNDEGNTAFGYNALSNVVFNTGSSGLRNIGIGPHSLNTLVGGNSNIAIGSQSLNANIVGDDNIAIGINSLLSTTTGRNICVGYSAAYQQTFAHNTCAYGYSSLSNLITGSHNLSFGNGSGISINDGNYNIFMGEGSGISAAGTSNYRIGIGKDAVVSADYCMQLGKPGAASNSGIGYFYSQKWMDEAWRDTVVGLAKIDGAGNFVKGTDAVSTGTDNHIIRWNGTTGLQDSPILIADTTAIMNLLPTTGLLEIQCDSSAVVKVQNVAGGSVAIGDRAFGGHDWATNKHTIAIGSEALLIGDMNDDVVAIGYRALKATPTLSGSGCTAIGAYSLLDSTSHFNTAFGYYSGTNITGGQHNLCLGESTGRTAAGSLTGAILIGLNAQTASNYYVQIGNPAGSGTAKGYFYSQLWMDAAWSDTYNKLAYIDGTGNFAKSSIVLPTGGAHNVTWTGAVNNTNSTLGYRITNSTCFLDIPAFIGSGASSATTIHNTGTELPALIRPVADHNETMYCQDNGTHMAAYVMVRTSGVISIYRMQVSGSNLVYSNFSSNAGNNGLIHTHTMTYSLT